MESRDGRERLVLKLKRVSAIAFSGVMVLAPYGAVFLTCLLAGGVTLYLGLFPGCSAAPHSVVETRSPTGEYFVRLSGQFGEPRGFTAQHYINADVYRGNVPLVTNAEIYYAGFLDSGFHGRFNPAVWTAENVISFPANRGERTTDRDEIWVTNQLPRTIEFLKIETQDLVLVFDLPPGGPLRIKSSSFRASGDVSWITVSGLAGGEQLPPRHASFTLTGRSTHDRYEIVITVTGTKVVARMATQPLTPP